MIQRRDGEDEDAPHERDQFARRLEKPEAYDEHGRARRRARGPEHEPHSPGQHDRKCSGPRAGERDASRQHAEEGQREGAGEDGGEVTIRALRGLARSLVGGVEDAL